MLPLNSAEIKRLSPLLVSRIAFGVRYEPQYALMQQSGTVVDSILRTTGTPFGPDRFPYSQADVHTNVLTDFEGNSLRFSHQDALLQLELNSRNLDRIEDMGNEFDKFVLRRLRELAKLRSITRYGLLIEMKEVKGLQMRPVQHYLSSEFPDGRANSLALRFTRRLPAEEALVRKGVDDYRNAIYTIQEDAEANVGLSIDYQEYFKPALTAGEWAEKPFPKFVSRGLAYFEGEFQRWFKQFDVSAAEVA